MEYLFSHLRPIYGWASLRVLISPLLRCSFEEDVTTEDERYLFDNMPYVEIDVCFSLWTTFDIIAESSGKN